MISIHLFWEESTLANILRCFAESTTYSLFIFLYFDMKLRSYFFNNGCLWKQTVPNRVFSGRPSCMLPDTHYYCCTTFNVWVCHSTVPNWSKDKSWTTWISSKGMPGGLDSHLRGNIAHTPQSCFRGKGDSGIVDTSTKFTLVKVKQSFWYLNHVCTVVVYLHIGQCLNFYQNDRNNYLPMYCRQCICTGPQKFGAIEHYSLR